MYNLTISDIASLAGVGIATVSRALNGTGYVSKKTQEKIERVIKENGYVPSAVAQGLSRQMTGTIGLIIPEADNSFFAAILNGVTNVIDENNLTLLLCNTNNSPKKDLRSLQIMKSQRICGLIFTPAAEYGSAPLDQKIVQQVDSLNCPIVILDRVIKGLPCDTVFSDNFGGAYTATEILINAGHRHIAVIAGDMELEIARERLNGFMHALTKYHLPFNEKESVIYGEFNADCTYEKTKEFLNHCQLPVAFFVSNNLESQGFFRAVSDMGLRIPEDVAYIGFDNVAGVNLLGNKYSYMDRDVVGMGQRAMQLLIKRINTPDKPVEHIYMPMVPKLYGSELLICK